MQKFRFTLVLYKFQYYDNDNVLTINKFIPIILPGRYLYVNYKFKYQDG